MDVARIYPKVISNWLKHWVIRATIRYQEELIKWFGKLIRNVNESKFLGVHIDKNISRRAHIGKVLVKVRQTMGIIGRARGFMKGPQLLLL